LGKRGEPAYLYEVFDSMPYIGYDIEYKNFKIEDRQYVESKEDNAELVRKVKNFVEGYWNP